MQSTYLHLLLFRGSPQGEKQKERSQWPGRDHHQTATPPRCSLSMPSPAPWLRTSPPDPDLTSESTFISSASRGGSQQTVVVPALQGCQGRLMARSKAEIRAIIMRVTRVVVRTIGTGLGGFIDLFLSIPFFVCLCLALERELGPGSAFPSGSKGRSKAGSAFR